MNKYVTNSRYHQQIQLIWFPQSLGWKSIDYWINTEDTKLGLY